MANEVLLKEKVSWQLPLLKFLLKSRLLNDEALTQALEKVLKSTYESFTSVYDFEKLADLDDVLTYFVFDVFGLRDSWKHLQELVRKKTPWPSVASWFKTRDRSVSFCFLTAREVIRCLAVAEDKNVSLDALQRLFEAAGKCYRPYVEELVSFFENVKSSLAYDNEVPPPPRAFFYLTLPSRPDESSDFFSVVVEAVQSALESGSESVRALTTTFEESSRALALALPLLKKDVLSFVDEECSTTVCDEEDKAFYVKLALLSHFTVTAVRAVLNRPLTPQQELLSKVFDVASSVGDSKERVLLRLLAKARCVLESQKQIVHFHSRLQLFYDDLKRKKQRLEELRKKKEKDSVEARELERSVQAIIHKMRRVQELERDLWKVEDLRDALQKTQDLKSALRLPGKGTYFTYLAFDEVFQELLKKAALLTYEEYLKVVKKAKVEAKEKLYETIKGRRVAL